MNETKYPKILSKMKSWEKTREVLRLTLLENAFVATPKQVFKLF